MIYSLNPQTADDDRELSRVVPLYAHNKHSSCKTEQDGQERTHFYLRHSPRLDLDDYNKEVKEGLHITSMQRTWMQHSLRIGGMRILDDIYPFTQEYQRRIGDPLLLRCEMFRYLRISPIRYYCTGVKTETL